MKNKKLRKLFRYVHLIIGLVAGAVVFVEAVTGALWVFNEEITAMTDPPVAVEHAPGTERLSPTQVREVAGAAVPGKAIHGVLYPAEGGPIEVIYYEAEPEFYYSVFLDPVTGEVLDREDHLEGFFAFILDGHLNLWLPPAIGEKVVTYATLLFLISIITGIVLWWPKNKKGRKQRFRFDWKSTTRWRRKNFDLHTVIGFYVSALALIFVLTGLIIGLNWFYKLVYYSTGGDKLTEFVIPENTSLTGNNASRIDELPALLAELYPTARDYEIHYPYADSVSIYVEVSYKDGVYYDADYVFFDQYTLEQVETPSVYGRYDEASVQDHAVRMSYDIHVGAIGGFPTKVLAFLASLLIATLPVTGVIIYAGRKRKTAGAVGGNKAVGRNVARAREERVSV